MVAEELRFARESRSHVTTDGAFIMFSIDVVVPCYRYGRFLEECVVSVLSQSGIEIRVLIIDDASPDDTPQVASRLVRMDPRVTYVRHQNNKGHIATYNEGIEWISSKYYLLLSADDYLLPESLGRALRVMEAHDSVGFCFGRALELRGDSLCNVPCGVNSAASHLDTGGLMAGRVFIEKYGFKNVVPTPTAIVRTTLQKQVGFYSTVLPHSGDMEMWLRLASHSDVAFLDADQAVYRRHATNMSSGYYVDSLLPDLEQRRLAIENFMNSCGHLLVERTALEGKMYRLLSREAVGIASEAFNEGKTEHMVHLLNFALAQDASVNTSLPWLKLSLKRKIGLRHWQTMQGFLGRVSLR
jgi:glycosyltransferase involved in cell wall biosynthesis